MEADKEVLERKTKETEAMRQRVIEMEAVKKLMEKQVKDYTIYEVTLIPTYCPLFLGFSVEFLLDSVHRGGDTCVYEFSGQKITTMFHFYQCPGVRA